MDNLKEIKFVPSGYIWEPTTPFFKDNTFEFIIAVLEKNKNLPLDKNYQIQSHLFLRIFLLTKEI